MRGDKLIEFELESLAKDNDRLSVDIRSLEAMIDKFMGFGVTVLGIGFTYGVEKDLLQVYLFLPVAMLGLLFFTIDRMRSQMWLGGYKHAVEDKINALTNLPLTNWEELVSKHRGRNDVIIKSTYCIYLLLFGGICAYCLYAVFNSDHAKINPISPVAAWRWFGVLLGVLVLLVVMLGLSARRLAAAYDTAYATSRELLGLPKLHHREATKSQRKPRSD